MTKVTSTTDPFEGSGKPEILKKIYAEEHTVEIGLKVHYVPETQLFEMSLDMDKLRKFDPELDEDMLQIWGLNCIVRYILNFVPNTRRWEYATQLMQDVWESINHSMGNATSCVIVFRANNGSSMIHIPDHVDKTTFEMCTDVLSLVLSKMGNSKERIRQALTTLRRNVRM